PTSEEVRKQLTLPCATCARRAWKVNWSLIDRWVNLSNTAKTPTVSLASTRSSSPSATLAWARRRRFLNWKNLPDIAIRSLGNGHGTHCGKSGRFPLPVRNRRPLFDRSGAQGLCKEG